MKLFVSAVAIFFSISFIDAKNIDLDEMADDFILETIKVEVPGYPFAFNPAIVRWQGKLLMSFRILPGSKKSFFSEMGIVLLNENFEPLNEPQILQIRDESAPVASRAEDLNFICIDDRLFIVYDDNEEIKISKGGFRVYVAELFYDGDHFIVGDIECMRYFEGESKNIREKNWVPFEYKSNLMLAYSLLPHKILMPRLNGSQTCDTISCTESQIRWNWGIMRGSTSATLEGDQYLAFFHSSKDMTTVQSHEKQSAHYFVGAYTFLKDPPFAITAISAKPIIHKNFYTGIEYIPYWKPIRCVFPRGYISDENFIWMSYGRDDHECWIAKIDKKRLLKSLVPVKWEEE